MEFLIQFKLNDHLYLRDPELSDIGRSIVRESINLIYEIGFEQFTFRKLALHIKTTETTIYRYFSSKHKLLIYILSWYWNYLELVCKFQLQRESDSKNKLKLILEIVTYNYPYGLEIKEYNMQRLHEIVISESSKSYLVKEVDDINDELVFSPLKSLCSFISEVILEINPKFDYPKSLASTLIETAHQQQFFSAHLPSLTDNKNKELHKEYVLAYLNSLAFSVIK